MDSAASIARQIIECSSPMPDPEGHYHWLLSLRMDVLRERLETIQGQKNEWSYRRQQAARPVEIPARPACENAAEICATLEALGA